MKVCPPKFSNDFTNTKHPPFGVTFTFLQSHSLLLRYYIASLLIFCLCVYSINKAILAELSSLLSIMSFLPLCSIPAKFFHFTLPNILCSRFAFLTLKLLHIGYRIYAVHFHKQQKSSKEIPQYGRHSYSFLWCGQSLNIWLRCHFSFLDVTSNRNSDTSLWFRFFFSMDI